MIYEQMKKEQQIVERRIARIEERLGNMPEGKLICAKNGNQYKWYISSEGKKEYISKQERILAEKLAQKRHLIALLEKAKCEKSAIDIFLKCYSKKSIRIDKEYLKNEEFCRLLGESMLDDMEKWMNEPYERSQKHPEHLIHKNSYGENFRSKSEAMIAMCLRERGIPYRYECAITLDGVTYYPDFTIKHPRTGRIYYYEHFGKMDDPKYIRDNMPKLSTYAMNGIVPGINLLLTFETKMEPLSVYMIESLLEQYFS